VAGSNYDVNIKLDVRKINQQISNLERRISKLNALAQGKKGDSKTLLKNERDKAALILKQERAQKRVNKELEKTNRLKKEELNLTKRVANKGKNFGQIGGSIGPELPPKRRPPRTPKPVPVPGVSAGGGGGVLSGALISGAFPLLFGQGPLGAAAGFGGGLIGGKLGGQTGGFAGGLVATAVLTQIQQTIDATSKLGQAFNVLTPDVEALTGALGIAGTEREKQIQLLKKSEGTQAALAAATEQMNQAIGADAVKELQEFGEVTRKIGNQFTLLGTKMLVALLPVLNLLTAPFAAPAQIAERDRLAEIGGSATDPKLAALEAQLASMGTGSGLGRKGVKDFSKKHK